MKQVKVGALIALCSVVSVAQAQVLNGGFENVNLGGADSSGPNYWTFTGGNTNISDWTVAAVSVDIVDSGYPVHSGNYALDLVGTPGPGEISQSVMLTAGQQYDLTFWAYSTGDPINMLLDVVDQANSNAFVFSITQGSWNQYTYSFTAGAASNLIKFKSDPGNTTNGNLFLDDIAVEAVPEPMTMIALAAGVSLAARRKRKQ
jgi:hypothetical protein